MLWLFGMIVQARSKILLRFADLLEQHNDELAALDTWDNGKPFEQARDAEVPSVARIFRYYAGTHTRSPQGGGLLLVSGHLLFEMNLT